MSHWKLHPARIVILLLLLLCWFVAAPWPLLAAGGPPDIAQIATPGPACAAAPCADCHLVVPTPLEYAPQTLTAPAAMLIQQRSCPQGLSTEDAGEGIPAGLFEPRRGRSPAV